MDDRGAVHGAGDRVPDGWLLKAFRPRPVLRTADVYAEAVVAPVPTALERLLAMAAGLGPTG